MQEALRTYLELALGLTEASRKRVKKVVSDVAGRGGATAEQVRELTQDLMSANSANREALAKLIRYEVDRALSAIGLATADEVGDLTDRIRDLERQLREAERSLQRTEAVAASARTAARKTATTRAPAKKAAPAKRPPAKKVAAKRAPARKAVAKQVGGGRGRA